VMTVRASIPWWPDAKRRFVLVVARPGGDAERAQRPILVSSAPEGPHGKEPHAELSLADTRLFPDGVLSGAVALRNVSFARYTGVELALVAREIARVRNARDVKEIARYDFPLQIETPQEAEPIPFLLRVPRDVVPTMREELFEVSWFIEVRGRRLLGKDLHFAVPVVMASAPGGQSESRERERRAPPVVGSERVRALWTGVGEPLGLSFADDRLTGRVGDTEVRIFREHRGAKGPHMVAELRYPSFELGLDGGLVSGFRRIFRDNPVRLGDSQWDRAHYLTGRHHEQVEAFARVLRPALAKARVADLGDTCMVLDRPGAGLSRDSIAALAESAMAIARLIPLARDAIPPPPGFDLESWWRLARALDGKLELARMVVQGNLDLEPVEVTTLWSDKLALETRLELRPRRGIDPRHSDSFVRPESAGAPLVSRQTDAKPEHLAEDARTCVLALLERALALAITAEAITLGFPAPLSDATPVERALPDLARLAELMRVGRGAYR
jgi:hypothetical protein